MRGRELLEKWIAMIEFHYEQASTRSDMRMIVQIQDNSVKLL